MAAKKSTRRPAKARANTGARNVQRWSQDVTEHSNALDLEPHLFASDNPEEIAASLKRSATSSRRRKGTAFQSAMSMLNFYINRAGRNLPKERRATLEQAKGKLREAFGRPP
ncbi:DUF3175 domain-containing protein [Cupriavidus necator]|uniref:DUF3175 domain-containing protein n=1 Tax=Cupriavidus necator TaxID=106590 RepID=UPI0005B50261|nr:DUF3175 domain-containing protein [Cupriavidus necator]